MKKACSGLMLVTFAFLLTYSTYAKEEQSIVSVTNSVLCSADIANLEIVKTFSSLWYYALDKNNTPLTIQRIDQRATLKEFRFGIQYAEFSSVENAFQGIKLHMGNLAAVFSKGMWSGAIQENIGEHSWYNEEPNSVGIIVLQGTTYVQICCDGGSAATRKKVCEQLALKIVEKIKNGGRVIIPEEKTVPPGKASP
jgi:hypothetical protein